MKYVIIILGVTASLFAMGCSFDPGVSQPTFCVDDSDCTDGRVCIDARCSGASNVSVSDDGVVDAGGQSDAERGEDGSVEQECSVDRDGDGFRVGPGCDPAELDCDDNDATIFPGAETRCNGEDNDCDGEIDTDGCECTDGQVEGCGSDLGACEKGERVCAQGAWGECAGEVGPATEECNGIDDDCDGTVDEGCPCDVGDRQPCGLDVGACQAGTQTCVDGMWSECDGAVGPSPEVCNNVDDDCDGTVDEDTSDGGAPCDTGADGICGRGALTCRAGSFICTSVQQARPETCNSLDDDCDGQVDEQLSQSCSSACGPGTQVCDVGTWGTCIPDDPPDELCNGFDDDCDGQVDESFPGDGEPCDTGLDGVCAEGALACSIAALICEPTNSPTAEICDGLDNDCDGLVDEDDRGLVLAEACGGACPSGSVRLCLNGGWSACAHGEVEICNGQDDNCDGVADNLATCYQRCDDGGYAVGTLNCSSGNCVLPPEICGDGIDNDCDGVIDQNCDSDYDDMAYIPGGTFIMGSQQNTPGSQADERPAHTVELDPFFIDLYEVSREDYGDCIAAGQCGLLRVGCPLQLTNRQRPIVCVTYDQAEDYCAWRGKRLPTEAEWEKAARGPFPREVLWPWGDAADSSRAAMDCSNSANQCTEDVTTMSVGSSYYGVHHMAGNAAEWVLDYYDPNFYSPDYTVQPQNTTPSSDGRVVRGGGYGQDLMFGRVANRAVDDFVANDEIGFRCAR